MDAETNFAARGGELVHLVCLVHLVGERDKLDKPAWLPLT